MYKTTILLLVGALSAANLHAESADSQQPSAQGVEKKPEQEPPKPASIAVHGTTAAIHPAPAVDGQTKEVFGPNVPNGSQGRANDGQRKMEAFQRKRLKMEKSRKESREK